MFQWLKSGEEAFPEMLAAIGRARSEIRLETYIFTEGPLGNEVLGALIAARARDVKVRVLVDALGSNGLGEEFAASLRMAGAEFRWFNPLTLSRMSVRDHRKMLTCDAEVGIIGGFNISDEYRGDGIRVGWRDVGLKVSGKPVQALNESFDEMYEMADARQGFLRIGNRSRVRRHYVTTGCELLLSGGGIGGFSPIKQSLRADLAQAPDVRIYAAYFLPTWRICRQLIRLARQGRKVQVILPGKTDVAVSQLASRSLYQMLLRNKVEIYEYQPQVLHAKLIIIGDVVYAGSANLDTRSLYINYELMVRVLDAGLAEEARGMFESDLARSKRIDIREWKKQRGVWEKLKERWAYFILARLDPFVARWQLREMR